MWLRRKDRKGAGGAAVAEPPAPQEEFEGSTEELFAEIEALRQATRAGADVATQRRLLWLRHLAGMRLVDAERPGPEYAEPAGGALPEAAGLPEVAGADVTPGLIRAGILRDGCLLVRGLVDPARAAELARGIDRGFEERARYEAKGRTREDGYYEEFRPHERYGGEVAGRDWIAEGGGLLAADAPRLAFGWTELLGAAGVPELVEAYLGEPVVTSVHKTTLRRATPDVGGAWHQDGNFMGDVRALNLWVALSRCGDIAPGLDLVPRRLEHIVASGTEDTFLDIQVSDANAREAAGDKEILRPVFMPGDAIFFDELFLHQTACDPAMTEPRFAVENWFFGASAFPDEYAPLAA